MGRAVLVEITRPEGRYFVEIWSDPFDDYDYWMEETVPPDDMSLYPGTTGIGAIYSDAPRASIIATLAGWNLWGLIRSDRPRHIKKPPRILSFSGQVMHDRRGVTEVFS